MTRSAKYYFRPAACLVAVLAISSVLSACAPLVIGGAAAAGTAVVITDRRSSGTQLDDKSISFKVTGEIMRLLGDTAKVDVTTYNSRVLLTGDVPTAQMKQQATKIAQGILKVKTVINQINVGEPQAFSARTNDTWLTSKVKAVLIRTQYVPSNTIDVTTTRGTVYLLGMVTENEGRYAANAAAGVGGVLRVVKLFETINREEAIRLSGAEAGAKTGDKSAPDAEQQAAPIDTVGGDGNSGGAAVEAMPIQ